MSSDIQSSVVEADVSVGDSTMYVTSCDVQRETGVTSSNASITGIVPDISDLDVGTRVDIDINDRRIFTGNVKHATQNNKGKITVEAYDMLSDLHQQKVTLNPEEPATVLATIKNFLRDADIEILTGEQTESFGFTSDATSPGEAYIAPADDFVGGNTSGKREYGSGKMGEPLTDVLLDLVKKLQGIIYVDRFNVLNIVPYPEYRSYECEYITSLDAGKGTTKQPDVTIVGGSPASKAGLGQAAAYSKEKFSSTASISSKKNPPKKNITDDNVAVQREADSMATSESVYNVRKTNAGSITIVGNASVQPFDHVTVPTYEYDFSITGSFHRVYNSLQSDDQFTVTSVSHKLDASNGYTTTLNLGPDDRDAFSNISGAAAHVAKESLKYVEQAETKAGKAKIGRGFSGT